MASESRVPSFPEGTFRAYAEYDSVSFGTSDGQSEQIAVRLRVSDKDPHREVVGMSILWFGNFLNQQAMDISARALQAMGWDGVSPIGTEVGHLAGLGGDNEVEIVVRHEEYNGKISAKVKFVNVIAGAFAFKKPLDATGLAKLNGRVMRHLGATAPRQAVPRAAQPPSAHKPEHRRYAVDPGTPPGVPVGAHPASGGYNPPVSDEERARAIDRGDDVKPPADGEGYGGVNADDDIPF